MLWVFGGMLLVLFVILGVSATNPNRRK